MRPIYTVLRKKSDIPFSFFFNKTKTKLILLTAVLLEVEGAGPHVPQCRTAGDAGGPSDDPVSAIVRGVCCSQVGDLVTEVSSCLCMHDSFGAVHPRVGEREMSCIVTRHLPPRPRSPASSRNHHRRHLSPTLVRARVWSYRLTVTVMRDRVS